MVPACRNCGSGPGLAAPHQWLGLFLKFFRRDRGTERSEVAPARLKFYFLLFDLGQRRDTVPGWSGAGCVRHSNGCRVYEMAFLGPTTYLP
jgi:hypothetical protein